MAWGQLKTNEHNDLSRNVKDVTENDGNKKKGENAQVWKRKFNSVAVKFNLPIKIHLWFCYFYFISQLNDE